MVESTGPRASSWVRAARHVLLATALVVLVCGLVGGMSLATYRALDASLAGLSEVVTGTVTPLGGSVVRAEWTSPDGLAHSADIPLAVTPPPAEAPATIAYDPRAPHRAVVPGAEIFADADRALGGVVFTALVTVLTAAHVVWLAVSRTLLLRRSPTRLAVRRLRVQRGLLTRSYLETESGPRRWVPVYFDPALPTLPTPTVVEAYGDPRRNRFVAFRVNGVTLFPSGRVRATEPPGRRTDNAAVPDAPESVPGMARQFRVDAPAALSAPLVGLFWAYIDSSGFPGWLAATALTAALAFWVWAVRGSDPS
ncbi:hypothetical protein GCM10010171_44470 [Actinokineospora fastidiosa]|uniref:DUF3592 domain-containing protein n=1 Tax=Actinokineospora fastidiosa TaxID=1816 RepID=A0A918GL55_9PSEU|nr:hypothetical protein GCM10010171_44470 [Actinokineospora fastidiosa]